MEIKDSDEAISIDSSPRSDALCQIASRSLHWAHSILSVQAPRMCSQWQKGSQIALLAMQTVETL